MSIAASLYRENSIYSAFNAHEDCMGDRVVSPYKESCNNKTMYGYMLHNLSPSPNLYKVQSVYNNNVAS